MKRKTQKVYKPLPPHTNEAHPVANAGQASKPFIIAVITIVAVVALTLLLLFSDRLVGKAFYTGEANTAGASLPSPAVEGQPFMVAVKANVGNQPAAAISFELTFQNWIGSCPQTLDLLNWPVKSISCDPDQKTVKYVAITNSPVSGEINIANLVFPGTGTGLGDFFDFDLNLEIKKPTAEPINLAVQSPFRVDIVSALVCGDGEVQGSEQCDDGNQNNFDSCNIACMLNPVACGNGIVNSNEQCDDGNVEDNDGCSAHCEIQGIPVCGDGVVDEIEQCDDGNTITESCAYGSYTCNICDAECNELTLPVSYCGDGNIDEQNEEVCDGQNLGGATCSSLGFVGGGTLLCAQNCRYNAIGCSSQELACGDGVVDSTLELCDDGNNVTNDGCSPTCNTEAGWNCSGQPSVCVVAQEPACGDGVVDSTLELCDDGNNVTNDGCSLTCNTEAGWNCSGQPSVCVASIQPLTVQGTKITLTDEDTGVLAVTKVTATESFSTEITVYTVLYGPNNKVLSIKSEKIETGLAQAATYLATVSYPLANVKSKSVIVFDVEQAPTVFGQLQKSYE